MSSVSGDAERQKTAKSLSLLDVLVTAVVTAVPVTAAALLLVVSSAGNYNIATTARGAQ